MRFLIMMNINTIANIAIVVVAAMAVVYMFYFEAIASKNSKLAQSDKYKTIYEIAKLIVDSFDPDKLGEFDREKAAQKVKEQAKTDGLTVTDAVASGAVKKAVEEKQAQNKAE